MGYRHKIIEEGNRKYLVIAVNPNTHIAFLSKTGKSLVYRIKGCYIDSKGYFKGSDDSLSGYISQPLAWVCEPVKRGYYDKNDIIKFDFGNDIVVYGIKIPIASYKLNN